MESISNRGIIYLLILSIICNYSLSQLTQTDTNYIKKSLLASQDETTGLFNKSADLTYKAAYSLKTLGENINNIPKICREISFEAMNKMTIEIVQLDELLNCKLNLDLIKEIRDEDLIKLDLNSLYEKIYLGSKSKAKFNWSTVYDITKTYVNSKENLFSNSSIELKSSLISTATGLKLLSMIHSNISEESQKNEVKELITLIVHNSQKEFQIIRDDIGLFTEEKVPSLKLNSEFAQALKSVKPIVSFDNFEELLLKILNYLVTFKYDYTGIENIYYLVNGINVLSDLPIVLFEKRVFDYAEEKYITLKLSNGFGRELNNYSVRYSYKLKETKQEKNKGDYDLEDEPTPESSSLSVSTSNSSTTLLDLSQLIKGPGKFSLQIVASFKNSENSVSFDQSLNFEINSLSKIKLNHLKMAVTNTQEKSDEKEITVEHPKRTFKNFKATQNSVIKLKVKLNYGDSQVNKIEQIFLRLRHTELGKSYSAYVHEYKANEEYYIINFDLSDPNTMDAYDGLYELTLIVSDVGLENPMIWNFGKIDVKFRKPLDPSNLNPSHKNVQKEKMEPSFPPEESPNKNIISSILFSGILVGLLGYFLIYLRLHKANMARFPKASQGTSFLFSLGFVILVLLITYIYILFFLKLNIIQTLFAILALGLPGSIIVYKALANHSIEV